MPWLPQVLAPLLAVWLALPAMQPSLADQLDPECASHQDSPGWF